MEQREGRIVRQGNMNEKVKIFRYVTEGTFDAYNWSTVEAKQKFIAQVFTSKSPARSADDVDDVALSYAEVKALAAGDDRIREKMELDVQVAKLKSMKSSHESECHDLQDLVRLKIPMQLQSNEIEINTLTKDKETVETHPIGDDNFKITVNGEVFTDRTDAGQAILDLCPTIQSSEEKLEIGTFRGLDMELHMKQSFSGMKFYVDMKGESTHAVELGSSPQGIITRMNNVLEQIAKKIETCENLKAKLETDLESAKGEMDKPFPREDELHDKSKRLTKLNRELEQDNGSEKPENKGEKGEKAPEKKSSVLGQLKDIKKGNEQKPPTEPPKTKGKLNQAI